MATKDVRIFKGIQDKVSDSDANTVYMDDIINLSTNREVGKLVSYENIEDKLRMIDYAALRSLTILAATQVRFSTPVQQDVIFVVCKDSANKRRIFADKWWDGTTWLTVSTATGISSVSAFIEWSEVLDRTVAGNVALKASTTATLAVIDSSFNPNTITDYYVGWWLYNITRGWMSKISASVISGGDLELTLIDDIYNQVTTDEVKVMRNETFMDTTATGTPKMYIREAKEVTEISDNMSFYWENDELEVYPDKLTSDYGQRIGYVKTSGFNDSRTYDSFFIYDNIIAPNTYELGLTVSGAVGAYKGTYSYKATAVYDDFGQESVSLFSLNSITGLVSNKLKITVKVNLRPSFNRRIKSVKIYRSLNTGNNISDYRFLKEIEVNGTGGIYDWTLDSVNNIYYSEFDDEDDPDQSTLGSTMDVTVGTTDKHGDGYIKYAQKTKAINRYFVGNILGREAFSGTSDDKAKFNRVHYSLINGSGVITRDIFPQLSYFNTKEQLTTETINFMGSYNRRLIIQTDTSTFVYNLSAGTPINWYEEIWLTQHGTVTPDTTLQIDGNFYSIDRFGVKSFNLQSSAVISTPIDNAFKSSIDNVALHKLAHDAYNNELIIYLYGVGIYVFSIDTNEFFKIIPNSYLPLKMFNEITGSYYYIGKVTVPFVDNRLFRKVAPYESAGIRPSSPQRFTTFYTDLGAERIHKYFRSVTITYKSDQLVNITFTYRYETDDGTLKEATTGIIELPISANLYSHQQILPQEVQGTAIKMNLELETPTETFELDSFSFDVRNRERNG